MANLLTTHFIQAVILQAIGMVEVGWQTGNSVVLNHDTEIATRACYGRVPRR